MFPAGFPQTVTTHLKCAKCGHKGRYNIGAFCVDPDGMKASERAEDYVSFTGYLRCRKCKSAWPWEFTAETLLALTAMVLAKSVDETDERLFYGGMRLFDGSASRSAAYAEDYLLDILERDPDNAFVWSRLGNLYRRVDLLPKAARAFGKAIKLNPEDLESHFGLGRLFRARGQCKKAEAHLHQVILLARRNTTLPEDFVRACVRESVDTLIAMAESDDEISVLPEFPAAPASDAPKTITLYLTNYDLSKEADWERLIDMLVGKKASPDMPRPAALAHGAKVGRNSPCPCGSGKKYKKCCGR